MTHCSGGNRLNYPCGTFRVEIGVGSGAYVSGTRLNCLDRSGEEPREQACFVLGHDQQDGEFWQTVVSSRNVG